jgi:uncharacterized membrane protein YsdA (DUF1294 family)
VLLFATDLRSGQQHFFVLALAVWLLLVNVLTLAIYGVDKMAARRTWRRVPEATLLTSAVGGWAGAIVGQQLFRQKRKAAVQDPVYHQHDPQHLRDGGDLCALSFGLSLSSGEINGWQKRGTHSTRRYP